METAVSSTPALRHFSVTFFKEGTFGWSLISAADGHVHFSDLAQIFIPIHLLKQPSHLSGIETGARLTVACDSPWLGLSHLLEMNPGCFMFLIHVRINSFWSLNCQVYGDLWGRRFWDRHWWWLGLQSLKDVSFWKLPQGSQIGKVRRSRATLTSSISLVRKT